MVKVYLMIVGSSHAIIILLLAFNLLPYSQDSLRLSLYCFLT